MDHRDAVSTKHKSFSAALRRAARVPHWKVAVAAAMSVVSLALPGCANAPARPAGWSAPAAFVAPSAFAGVHGLAIDRRGRLLAGSVLGSSIWEIDRRTGAARVFIPAPEGQADDIAIGPNGEMAWTSYVHGVLRYRERDDAPIRELAKDLPGINSLDFDRRNGKLYASQVFAGDALWEIDVAGTKPPRLIAKDLGGFNGFEVGPDGMLYGPLWFKHQVVRIDPADGAVRVISSEFETPAAVNLDGTGRLWVVDAKTGELSSVDAATGRKAVATMLKPALDNLVIAPDGTIYVSNMADNSIQAFEPASGNVRALTAGKLPAALGLRVEGGRMWVAGLFAVREVDLATGDVIDLMRMWSSAISYPSAVGASARHLVLASVVTGMVQQLERGSWKTVAAGMFNAPTDALPLADGSILVAEEGTGSIVRARGPELKDRDVVAERVDHPMQMTIARDGGLYVTQATGTLLRVDLGDRSTRTIATGLELPKGVAQTPWGTFVVLEAAARRLTEVEPASGERRTIASDLPVGMAGAIMPTGVAVDADGNVYLSADANNAIYTVRPRK